MSTSPLAAPALEPGSARPASANKFDAFAARFTERWWVEIPGRLRKYSTLLWAAWTDGTYLTAWPRTATILPIAALLFGLFEGATHWTFVQWDAAGAHWGISYIGHGSFPWVFAQILPVLVLAAILGSLSANLGLMLATGYALADFLFVDEPWAHHDAIGRFFHFHVPQLICYLLFLLLAVWPVVCTRSLVAGVHRRLREQADGVYTAVTAIVLALFVYEWTYLAPMVFRVAWVWQAGLASPFSVLLFQAFTMPWLVTSAVGGVLLRHWLSNRAEATDGDGLETRGRALMAQAAAAPLRRRPWLQALLGAAYMTLLMSGFLDAIAVGALIFAGIFSLLLARNYWLPRMQLWNKWSGLMAGLPALYRVAVVSVGAYFITLAILNIPGMAAAQNPRAGQFGAEVLALLISFLLMLLLLPNGVLAADEFTASRQTLRLAVPGTATQIGLIVALALLAAKRAFAQGNVCADPGCCFGGNNNVAGGVNGGYMPSYTAGIPALGGLPPRGKKGHRPPKRPHTPPPTPEPCTDEKQKLREAQGKLAADQGQRDHYAGEVDQFAGQLEPLIPRAQQLISRIRAAINWTPANTMIGTYLPSGWDNPGGLDNMTASQWQSLANALSRLQGADIQSDIQEFVSDAANIVSLTAQLDAAKANWNTYEDNCIADQRAVIDAEDALRLCQDTQAGNASAGNSTGDGAGATS